MGCGASASENKYKSGTEPPAATAAQKDVQSASREPAKVETAKEAPTAQELPPEKPPEAAPSAEPAGAKAAPPVAEEQPAAVAEEASPAEVPAAEPAAAAAAEAPEPAAETAEAAEAAEAPSPVSATEPLPAEEKAPSLAAEAVVAEAEAALAEAAASPREQESALSESPLMRYEDPEFPSFRPLTNASALLEVDRSSGARLGIHVRGAETVLLVTQVEKEGLVPAWNAQHPERIVQPGSRIIQVNGLCGIADQLLEELQREASLRIEVDRTDREVKASLTSSGMAHWCREQIQGMYERHDEAGLKTLDRRMNTYKDRELALYRTLSKKFGEEPRDPELCPNGIEDTQL